jgi:hypothetical protein
MLELLSMCFLHCLRRSSLKWHRKYSYYKYLRGPAYAQYIHYQKDASFCFFGTAHRHR